VFASENSPHPIALSDLTLATIRSP